MRGMDEMQEPLFTTVKLEDFVPADHPLRPIRLLVNDALERLNGLFSVIYADTGRASVAPEKLMRALLLQVFYPVRPIAGSQLHPLNFVGDEGREDDRKFLRVSAVPAYNFVLRC